ncbi:molecular chaperone [Coemansia sp. RSA 1290]|nr:molecular chaperone [Coemansia sp. RSA 1290]
MIRANLLKVWQESVPLLLVRRGIQAHSTSAMRRRFCSSEQRGALAVTRFWQPQRYYSADLRSTARTCWRCRQSTSQTGVLCDNAQCATVQPVGSATYFDVLLGKSATFDVDIAQLRRRFLRLQQAVHPDSFSQREDTERQLAEAQSAWINHAYATLKDPLQRAHYLLELSGRAVREEDQVTNPELLMEVMEMREQIEAATNSEQIATLQKHNEAEIAAAIRELSQAFAAGNLDAAQRGANRLQYLRRAGQAIHAWEPGKRVVVPH